MVVTKKEINATNNIHLTPAFIIDCTITFITKMLITTHQRIAMTEISSLAIPFVVVI